MISDEERRKVAARLRIEGEMWRAYFGSYTRFDMPDHMFTNSVLEAFDLDDTVMDAHRIFERMADIVDPEGGDDDWRSATARGGCKATQHEAGGDHGPVR